MNERLSSSSRPLRCKNGYGPVALEERKSCVKPFSGRAFQLYSCGHARQVTWSSNKRRLPARRDFFAACGNLLRRQAVCDFAANTDAAQLVRAQASTSSCPRPAPPAAGLSCLPSLWARHPGPYSLHEAVRAVHNCPRMVTPALWAISPGSLSCTKSSKTSRAP